MLFLIVFMFFVLSSTVYSISLVSFPSSESFSSLVSLNLNKRSTYMLNEPLLIDIEFIN